jgi:hypothetical protein
MDQAINGEARSAVAHLEGKVEEFHIQTRERLTSTEGRLSLVEQDARTAFEKAGRAEVKGEHMDLRLIHLEELCESIGKTLTELATDKVRLSGQSKVYIAFMTGVVGPGLMVLAAWLWQMFK